MVTATYDAGLLAERSPTVYFGGTTLNACGSAPNKFTVGHHNLADYHLFIPFGGHLHSKANLQGQRGSSKHSGLAFMDQALGNHLKTALLKHVA